MESAAATLTAKTAAPEFVLNALGLDRVKRTVLDAVRESIERPSQQAAFTARLLGGSVYIDHADQPVVLM